MIIFFLLKVAWIKVANTDVLAIGDYKVTNDDRIKIVHGYVTDWSLSIQPVSEEDSGEYICQINTEPQMVMKINLQVLCTNYIFLNISFSFYPMLKLISDLETKSFSIL